MTTPCCVSNNSVIVLFLRRVLFRFLFKHREGTLTEPIGADLRVVVSVLHLSHWPTLYTASRWFFKPREIIL